MGRGIGSRQAIVLRALQRLERERGPGWRTPADVLGALDAIIGVPSDVSPVDAHVDRTERLQLANLLELVRAGHGGFMPGAAVLEHRIETRAAALAAERARREAERAPNLRRRAPRAGEDGNPSRVFAALERRGLVERVARRGPGSAVRLMPAGG